MQKAAHSVICTPCPVSPSLPGGQSLGEGRLPRAGSEQEGSERGREGAQVSAGKQQGHTVSSPPGVGARDPVQAGAQPRPGCCKGKPPTVLAESVCGRAGGRESGGAAVLTPARDFWMFSRALAMSRRITLAPCSCRQCRKNQSSVSVKKKILKNLKKKKKEKNPMPLPWRTKKRCADQSSAGQQEARGRSPAAATPASPPPKTLPPAAGRGPRPLAPAQPTAPTQPVPGTRRWPRARSSARRTSFPPRRT